MVYDLGDFGKCVFQNDGGGRTAKAGYRHKTHIVKGFWQFFKANTCRSQPFLQGRRSQTCPLLIMRRKQGRFVGDCRNVFGGYRICAV